MDDYVIKDLGVGYGVFTETVGQVALKDNMLINMGESYIVTNLQTEPEEGEEEEQLMPPKLKLRVFSVSKSDQPDLYCCQHLE